MKTRWTLFALLTWAGSTAVHAAEATPPTLEPLVEKDLPALAGQAGLLATVTYAPGGASGPHRHNADTFVYVLEGSVVMQVEGGEAQTLGPGDTFYESRADIHAVSKNASMTEPAKFLVFIIKDKDAPISVPVDAGH
jgi:quercetin dioxygenase-like cupin family protein